MESGIIIVVSARGADDGLEYKKYTPSSDEEEWLRNSVYSNQAIMKF